MCGFCLPDTPDEDTYEAEIAPPTPTGLVKFKERRDMLRSYINEHIRILVLAHPELTPWEVGHAVLDTCVKRIDDAFVTKSLDGNLAETYLPATIQAAQKDPDQPADSTSPATKEAVYTKLYTNPKFGESWADELVPSSPPTDIVLEGVDIGGKPFKYPVTVGALLTSQFVETYALYPPPGYWLQQQPSNDLYKVVES